MTFHGVWCQEMSQGLKIIFSIIIKGDTILRCNCWMHHRCALLFVVAISSYNHKERKQPQKNINELKKHRGQNFWWLLATTTEQMHCKKSPVRSNYWWLLPLFQKLSVNPHIFFCLRIKHLLLRKTDILKTCQKLNFSERKFEEMHSYEEQKGASYIRENVYFGIIIFNCLSFTKTCLRFLLNCFVGEIKGFYQSSLGYEVGFSDNNVSQNILAKN